MDSIASALGDIPALVWGERAISALGARVVCDNYVLVIDDADLDDAAQRLRLRGFRACAWSYGSVEPSFYNEKQLMHIYRRIINHYRNVDLNSARFLFPLEQHNEAKVILLRSSYAHIPVRSAPDEAITRSGNLLYPNAALLLQSIVQTLVREPVQGLWTSCLSAWAISYIYGQLMLSDDVLDACDDEDARAWFDKKIRRSNGGLDGVTYSKRLGRVGYDDSLAKMPCLGSDLNT